MLASVVTLLVVLGTLFILLCNAGMTGFFLRSPPRGDSAVGLVVPAIGLIAAAAAITLASLLMSFRAERPTLGLLPASQLVSGILIVAVTLGVVLAALMAFAAWVEPVSANTKLRPLFLALTNACGVIGPLLLATAILVVTWKSSQWISGNLTWLRSMCWTLVALAATGYAIGGVLISVPVISRYNRMQAIAAQVTPEEKAIRDKLRNTPIEQQLREHLDTLPPDAPLSEVIVYFDPSSSAAKLNAACKTMLIEHVLARPDMSQQLIECAQKREYCFPRGLAELVRALPQDTLLAHQEAWAHAVVVGINAMAEGMAIRPAWLTETFDNKPEPMEHVRAFLAAAERFKGLEGAKQIDEALRQLAKDARELTRDKKWDKLAKELKRAGYPVPPDDGPG